MFGFKTYKIFLFTKEELFDNIHKKSTKGEARV